MTNDEQNRYERVAETGFEDFEDLERFQATHHEKRWCDVQGRETLHRDHIGLLGVSDAELVCIPCFSDRMRGLSKGS